MVSCVCGGLALLSAAAAAAGEGAAPATASGPVAEAAAPAAAAKGGKLGSASGTPGASSGAPISAAASALLSVTAPLEACGSWVAAQSAGIAATDNFAQKYAQVSSSKYPFQAYLQLYCFRYELAPQWNQEIGSRHSAC